jgi:hypothetical protein
MSGLREATSDLTLFTSKINNQKKLPTHNEQISHGGALPTLDSPTI